MNVIIVNPPIQLASQSGDYPLFSTLGPLINAAWLRTCGFNVRFVDAFTLQPRLNLRPAGQGLRHVGSEVRDVVAAASAVAAELHGPTVIIVATTAHSPLMRLSETLIPSTVRGLSRAVADVPIALADLFVTGTNYHRFDPVWVLERLPELSWILVGEAERTLPLLLERMQAGAGFEGLPRVAWRPADGRPTYDATPPKQFEPLDDLPLPAFDLIDMDNYFLVQADAIRADLVQEYHRVERMLPLLTSRSCPYRCSFCIKQVFDLAWKAHSVSYVVDAVQTLRKRYGIDRLLLFDDSINADEKRFRKLVSALHQMSMPWDAVNGFRADHLDREAVELMKQTGNTKVTVSVESADPDVAQRIVRKGLGLSSVVRLAEQCHELRMPLQVHYMVGIPGETKAQMNHTLQFAADLLERYAAWPLVQHFIPSEGTKLHRVCETNGYFAIHPLSVGLDTFQAKSIVRTESFTPGEVERMKHNARRLFRAMRKTTYLEVTSKTLNQGVIEQGTRCPKAPEPTMDQLRSRLIEGRFRGAEELLLGGGEPTTRPELARIIDEARRLGYRRVVLITDASTFAPGAGGQRLVQAGVDGAVVLLLGSTSRTHDRLAGRNGALSGTLAGLRRLASMNVPYEIEIPILRSNAARLVRIVRFANRLHPTRIVLRYPATDSRRVARHEIPSWAAVKPHVLSAASVVPGKVQVQGAPLCWLPEAPGLVQPLAPWLHFRSLPHRVRPKRCTECVALVVCGGLPTLEGSSSESGSRANDDVR